MTSFLSDNCIKEISSCDAIITSSHKGMCCSPGIVFVTYKKSLLHRENSKRILSIYCDLKIYEKNFYRNQTPYTPAVGVIIELNDIFSFIKQIGLNKWLKDISERSLIFRSSLKENWILPKHRLSNFMTPILLEKNSNKTSKDIIFELENNKGIDITPIAGIFKDRMLRISHVGDHSIEELQELAYYLNSLLD